MAGEFRALPGIPHLDPPIPCLNEKRILEKCFPGKLTLSIPFLFLFLFLISIPFLGNWYGLFASRLLPQCFPIDSR